MFKKKVRKKREVQPVSERKLAEPPKVTPGLLNTKNVPVALAAKARWADLKSHVSKDIDTVGKVKNIKIKYRVSDVWQQMMDNDVDEDVDRISEVGRKREGMRLKIHLYDTMYPPSTSKYVTKWSRPPQLTFLQNIGDGNQDFHGGVYIYYCY